MSNLAKGRISRDATLGGTLVEYFNKNVTPYPTDIGGPAFDLVPVTKQKDIMLNVARMQAQQEYDRIMQLVEVLQSQAHALQRRLEITDAVHEAEYDFQIYHGHAYWLVYDTHKKRTSLRHHGPNDTLVTDNLEWIACVKWLGDHTWIEVSDDQL